MRILSIVFATLAVAILLADPYIQVHYLDTRPERPDVMKGRVHEFSSRGRVVYLNNTEHRVTFWAFKIGALSGLIAVGLWKLADRKTTVPRQ